MRVVQGVRGRGISEGRGVGLTLEGTLVVAERPFPGVPAQQLLQGEGTAQTMDAHPSSGRAPDLPPGRHAPAAGAPASPRSLSLGL